MKNLAKLTLVTWALAAGWLCYPGTAFAQPCKEKCEANCRSKYGPSSKGPSLCLNFCSQRPSCKGSKGKKANS
jgi:hypothetical protein